MRRIWTALLTAAAGLCLTAAVAPATGAAAATAAAAPADGQWTAAAPVPGLATLNVGQQATLNDIACASGFNCAAGGTYTDRAGHRQAWIASEADGGWGAAEEVPGTARLNPGGNAAVDLVACPAPGDCMAIGEDLGSAGQQSMFASAEVKGGGWADARPVTLGIASQAIACPSAGDCVVGGSTMGNAAVADGYGVAWGVPRTLPGVTALGPDGSSVETLTCTSAGNCVAGGTYEVPASLPPGSSHQQPFVAAEVNGVWQRAVAVPGAAGLNAGGYAQVSAISCASAGNCAVGGSYENILGIPLAYVADEVHGRWETARAIPGTTATTGSQVSGLTCTAAATCVAVGSAGADGFTALENNGTWRQATLVPDLAGDGTSVDAVSCRSAGNCLAVGSAPLGPTGDSFSDGAESFALTEIAGTWSKPKVLTVANNGVTDSAALACGPGGDCSVGGNIQYGTSYQTAAAPLGAYVAGYAAAG